MYYKLGSFDAVLYYALHKNLPKFSDGKTLRYLINIIHYMAYYSYRGEHDDLFGRIGKKNDGIERKNEVR